MSGLEKLRNGVGEPNNRSSWQVQNTQTIGQVQIHDVLRNERRRGALKHLINNGGATSLRQLAEIIAENETGEQPPPRDTRNSVYISLHQTHLPKLDRLGIVRYDNSAKDIELRGGIERLKPYLNPNDPGLSIRPLVYLLFGIAGALGVTASVYGFGPFSLVTPTGWLLGYLVVSMFFAGLELAGDVFHPDFD